MEKIVADAGCEIRTSSRVTKVTRSSNEFVMGTVKGEVQARAIINCARLAIRPHRSIVRCRSQNANHPLPRRILRDRPRKRASGFATWYIRCQIRAFHFSVSILPRMIHGGIEAGPNAVLAFKREGYEFGDISIPDLFQYGTFSGFWRMVLKYWKTGFGEMYRSLSKAAFVHALQHLVPEIEDKDIHRSGSGVRAQALAPNGALLDDFAIAEADHMIHVLNAPSPAATASISIGENDRRHGDQEFWITCQVTHACKGAITSRTCCNDPPSHRIASSLLSPFNGKLPGNCTTRYSICP